MQIIENLYENLNSYSDQNNEDEITSSSVLLILSQNKGEFGINFIKRASFQGDAFSGHVAFPGGKRKKSDKSALDTAIRETKEEIGINILDYGEIVGSLDTVRPFTQSVSHFVVKPFVSILNDDVSFKKNYEVEDIFWVSIKHLVDDKNRTTREKIRDGVKIYDYVFNYDNYIIWGLTGRILNQFFEKTINIFESNF